MGFFDRIFRKKSMQPVSGGVGGWRTFIHEPFAGAWQSNQELRRQDVLSFHAVFACITLIAGDVGKLSLNLKKESEEGVKQTVKDKRFKVLEKPNRLQTRQQFFESWILSKASRGNAYILKYRDVFGEIIGLYVLNPDLVTPLVDDFGNAFYQVNPDKNAAVSTFTIFPASEIIHDRYNCLYHPLMGMTAIMACGLSAGMGLAILKNSSSFFGNMSRPSGILTAPGPIDADKAAAIRDKWNANYSAGNYGKTAVLGDGLTYQAMAVAASDAQMLEQLKFSGEIVCSVFHVPPYKIGLGTLPAGQKTGDMNEIYYSDCLQTYLEAIENLLNEHLELDKYDYSVEFDLDGLIRMDGESQMKILTEGVKGAIYSPDEARLKLNLPPVPGGKYPFLQQQNYSLEALAKRDAKDDPFASGKATTTPAESPKNSDSSDDQGKTIQALIQRIETLEKRATVQYCGVFDVAKSYAVGDMVTHGGSVWHCDQAHHGDWSQDSFTLAVKKGRDARPQE